MTTFVAEDLATLGLDPERLPRLGKAAFDQLIQKARTRRFEELVVWLQPDAGRCGTRRHLAAYLRDADLGALAQAVEAIPTLRGHVLAFVDAEETGILQMPLFACGAR